MALVAVFAAALALRDYRLGERSLWFDEAFSWRLTTFSWGEMLQRTARDNNPPFYYAALKLWTNAFGDSALALRGLSALCGALSCLGMYLVTVELAASTHDERTNGRSVDSARWLGVCTAAFVAFNVFQLRWAREARMYAMGAALCAFSSWLLLRALHARRRLRSLWTAYAVTALAFTYTHNCAIFSIAAQTVYLVGFLIVRNGGPALASSLGPPYAPRDMQQAGRPLHDLPGGEQAERAHHKATRRFAPVVAMLVVIAGWMAWLPVLQGQRAQVSQAFWLGGIGWRDLPNACYEWFGDIEPLLIPKDMALVAAVVCAASLGLLLFRPRPGDPFVFIAAAGPIGLIAIVSAVDSNILGARYLFFSQLFLLAALARLAWRLASKLERGALLAVMFANLVYPDLELLDRMAAADAPGVRGAVVAIEQAGRRDEPVIVACPYFFFPVLFHLSNRANCFLYDDGHAFRHYEGTAVLTPGDLLDAMRLASLDSPRLWVVNNHSPALWGRPPMPVPPHWQAVSRNQFREAYGIQGRVEVVEYRISEK